MKFYRYRPTLNSPFREIRLIWRLAVASGAGLLISSAALAQEDRFESGLAAKERGHFATAIKAWLPIAEAGNPEAQNNLGFMYEDGLGVRQNYLLAMNWYRQAADSGLAQAQHNMGMLYHHGYGVAQNLPEAFRWFTKAAAQELAESEYMLALALQKGEGTALDYGMARVNFLSAARKGYAPAQLMYAFMLQAGEGGEPDSYRALVWATLAQAQEMDSAIDIAVLAELQLDESEIAAAAVEAATCLASDFASCAD